MSESSIDGPEKMSESGIEDPEKMSESFPLEIALQVRNAPVVDVRVRRFESPHLWVL